MLLSVDNLCKSFGPITVTDHLSFDLEEGQALGILGPNGAGKSTMFNLITGDLKPSSGFISFEQEDLRPLAPHERCHKGIGRSYQIPHPFIKMTVFENLLVACQFGSSLPANQHTDHCVEVLRQTGLLAKANDLAGSLTLLQRKRLELARALATSPKLMLLDEIAGGLTEGECHELVETIQTLRKDGISIIWIEHVVHALLAVVDKLLVINFGAKIAEGAPDAVLKDPVVREVYMGMAE